MLRTFAKSTSVFAWSLSFLCSILTLLNLSRKEAGAGGQPKRNRWGKSKEDTQIYKTGKGFHRGISEEGMQEFKEDVVKWGKARV